MDQQDNRPVPPAPVRTYDVVLAYRPASPALGFEISFKARDVDTSDPNFISVEHGPEFHITTNGTSDEFVLKIGGTEHLVSWLGTSFRFPNRGLYGITVLRRSPARSDT